MKNPPSGTPRKTQLRKDVARKAIRSGKNLVAKGWKYDGLWWTSPYTGIRYPKLIATYIEELRDWGESGSAYLEDKYHSVWAIEEAEANKIVSWEDLSEDVQERSLMRASSRD
jgi:hypothetical protein